MGGRERLGDRALRRALHCIWSRCQRVRASGGRVSLNLWVNIAAAMAKSFNALFEQAHKSDEYWLDGPILEFGEELSRLMLEQKISKAELARRLGTSPAYVTKVLRGNANFTLRTIAKLGRVFDCRPRLHLAPAETI